MRSVRLGRDALYHWDLSLAMTGRDKLRQDMAGLGRTGHLSAPLGNVLMVVAMSRHPQQVIRPTTKTLVFSLQKS